MPLKLKDQSAAPPPAPRPRKVVDAGFFVLALSSLAAAVAVWVLRGPDRVAEILTLELGFIAALTPKILAGVFLAATLPLLLPKDKVAAWIGRDSGTRGLALAMLAGAAIPGGPMMTFPLAAGFATVGADLGAVLAFVTGWALLNLNRTLIWEFSFLPADLVWLRLALCLPFPVLVGLAARAIWKRRP